MRVSVAVLYDHAERAFMVFNEREVPQMIRRLRELELVVGFNLKRFDYRVLQAYTAYDLQGLPTLDLLEDIHRTLGFRVSLDALCAATLRRKKSADGVQAVEWWREGKHALLTEYCRRDVEMTLRLARYGQLRGHLLFERKDQGLLRVPVDWSWPALRRRFKG